MTIFEHDGLKLRISLDGGGRDRFTKEEIIKLIENRQTYIGGDHSHCLCRYGDGAVLAEIKKNAEGGIWQDDHTPRAQRAGVIRARIKNSNRKRAVTLKGRKSSLQALIFDLYQELDVVHPNWSECDQCRGVMQQADVINRTSVGSIQQMTLVAGKLLAEMSGFMEDRGMGIPFDKLKARYMAL